MNLFSRFVCVCALAGVAACGGSTPEQKPAAAQGKHVDPATTGSISGTVKFDGAPPSAEAIHLTKDCTAGPGPNPQNEDVLVGDGNTLQNVFVYVRDGLDPSYTFDTPATPVELKQTGCIYRPRVLGVQVGQSIDVVNADATLHNVHALPMVNSEFNKHQPKQNDHMTHVFTAPEVMVKFKCDVHPWMASWVGVVAHPFFAVSDQSGHFDIKGLPPGTYTVEAWHEKYGRQTSKVTVSDHTDQAIAFTFKADGK
jgi:plastocyanin